MRKSHGDIRTKIEYLPVFSTGSISLIIAALDLTGSLDSDSWVAQRVSKLTLLAVGFTVSCLILERRSKIDTLADRLDRGIEGIVQAIANASANTVKSLDGVEVISFSSSADTLIYASKRFRRATRIDDVTWGGLYQVLPRSWKDIEAYQEYRETITDTVKKSKSDLPRSRDFSF